MKNFLLSLLVMVNLVTSNLVTSNLNALKIISVGNIKFTTNDRLELESLGDLEVYNKPISNEKNLIEIIGDADILISDGNPLSDKVLSEAAKNNLKFICLASSSFHRIDLKSAIKNNLKVSVVKDFSVDSVAEHSISLMLSVAKLLFPFAIDLRYGHRSDYLGLQLKDKNLGIVGTSKICDRVGEIANGLGMNVNAINFHSTREDFENLLINSDYLFFNIPFDDGTKNFIGLDEFKLMKDGVVIVNTTRGILDEDALYASLKNRKVFGAGLTVSNDQSVNNKLFEFPNVMLVPIAYTRESLIKRSENILEIVKGYVDEKPINLVF